MAISKDPVPVRIQFWVGDTRMDIRGWLSDFEATSDVPGLKFPRNARPNLRHDYTLRAFTDWQLTPWKFRRGKPDVALHGDKL